MKHIVSVSLGEDTVGKIRELLRKGRFRNKSHVVEEAIIEFFGRGGKENGEP
jgi:Arc/MetJ-type ribon-helix-helix transcriptional regulator